MNFDPAVAALHAFQRATRNGELGPFEEDISEAEDTFSSGVGSEAKAAYQTLQGIGEQLPDSRAFQEFLIFITWQQVTEETIPEYFHKGITLCQKYLSRFEKEVRGTETDEQIRAIYKSFQSGLGKTDDPLPEYTEDAFQGGD